MSAELSQILLPHHRHPRARGRRNTVSSAPLPLLLIAPGLIDTSTTTSTTAHRRHRRGARLRSGWRGRLADRRSSQSVYTHCLARSSTSTRYEPQRASLQQDKARRRHASDPGYVPWLQATANKHVPKVETDVRADEVRTRGGGVESDEGSDDEGGSATDNNFYWTAEENGWT